jgi:hypothetical protein
MSSNPLRTTLLDEAPDDTTRTTFALEEKQTEENSQDNHYDKSVRASGKFDLLDVSLAKCLKEVVESTPKVLWNAYDKYADTNEWCKLDQVRLISLDFMFRRYLSFHRNHLSFKLSKTESYTKWLPSFKHDLDTVAFATQSFGRNKPYEPVKQTPFYHMQQELEVLSKQKEDLLWLHISDVRCLDAVMKTFNLHKYVHRFFMDLR